ncbi:hypothetical protein LU293_08835 [Moraxella nasovis]|uniref:hypothetical protein n=1 Tax=Moraxella nasovis TaxID=2904121 RepID=UPI001F605597|nr:hypothetical protein [Moraxella nasovis]UNU73165.1 hypothetical protein LU293_08835 [Moraxella nasovis]
MTDIKTTHVQTDATLDNSKPTLMQKISDISSFNSDNFIEDLFVSWQQTLGSIKHSYATAADNFLDEIYITLSEEQVNDALKQFVVDNVGMLLDLKLELHDDWLRLSTTVDVAGIFASVASNFELVQIQLDRYTQRLVLRQISNTDVIELHSRTWWQAPAAKFALGAYRTILRKDPLPFILSQVKIKGVPFTEHKGDVIYLEIGRWLKNVKVLTNNIKKAQINTATTKENQLILKIQINFGEVLSFGDANANIITEEDKPKTEQPKAPKTEPI